MMRDEVMSEGCVALVVSSLLVQVANECERFDSWLLYIAWQEQSSKIVDVIIFHDGVDEGIRH